MSELVNFRPVVRHLGRLSIGVDISVPGHRGPPAVDAGVDQGGPTRADRDAPRASNSGGRL